MLSRGLLLRFLGMVALGVAGWEVGIFLGMAEDMRWGLSLALFGAVLGFLLTPYLVVRPLSWALGRIKQVPAQLLVLAIAGLVIGLIISALLAFPLSMLPGLSGRILPIAASLLLSYFGISIMLARGRDLWQVASSYLPGSSKGIFKRMPRNGQILLDTSAIIDGRIADISQTGFIRGSFFIPQFILDELRHIADSPDSLRRSRGRRGLDILSKLQRESPLPVKISEADIKDVQEVDAKLVKLAKNLHCAIMTNDFGLNRVAKLQGVQVLNINDLANAVRSVLLPGEEIPVRIIQEGKEAGQGVAFLDDGTMVVVEGGRRYINTELDIVVTRVLQTTAGRMLFAHPKAE